MRILVAPLNWGLGHASRCIPLVTRFLSEGYDVVLAGDGDSLLLLRRHFPSLPYFPLASLNLHYGSGSSQVWAVLRALPALVRFSVADHWRLRHLLMTEHFDLVVSDNRFGLYSHKTRCVYITHQLLVLLPPRLRFMQPLLRRLHAAVIRHFSECWVPDNAGRPWLAGDMAHKYPLPPNARFIGLLSRFDGCKPLDRTPEYDVVAVISGPEPQRTMFEEKVCAEWQGRKERVLVVRGKPSLPATAMKKDGITLVPDLDDRALARHLTSARTVISRSGYSSVMDYYALGLLDKQKRGELTLTLVPTPGQPEQEYLAVLHAHSFNG